MSDPIAEAAASLEGDGAAGGEADLTADQEGGADLEDVDEATHWSGRLWEPLDGDLQDDHLGELWDPEGGGPNRLALVAKEVAGLESRLPRIAHGVIGAAEWYVSRGEHLSLPSLGSGDEDDQGDLYGA